MAVHRALLLLLLREAAAGSVLEPPDEGARISLLHEWPEKHGSPGNPLQYVQGTPEIVFAVSTGQVHFKDRAAGVLDTWCSEINACIFFSDVGNPAGHPYVVPLGHQGAPDDVDPYKQAQLRFLPILENMRHLLVKNKYGLFSNCKWVVMTDDDTYVFYRNLKDMLSTLPSDQPVYTGNVIPPGMLPVHCDGAGNELGVSSNISFVLGGGGSVFSAAAMRKMDVKQCVANQERGGKWDKWQSDWMLGGCAHDAGITPTPLQKGLFNQFLCVDGNQEVHFCVYGRAVDAQLTAPCTLHPIKHLETMSKLRSDYPYADTMPVRDVVVEVGEEEVRSMDKAKAASWRAKQAQVKQQQAKQSDESGNTNASLDSNSSSTTP